MGITDRVPCCESEVIFRQENNKLLQNIGSEGKEAKWTSLRGKSHIVTPARRIDFRSGFQGTYSLLGALLG